MSRARKFYEEHYKENEKWKKKSAYLEPDWRVFRFAIAYHEYRVNKVTDYEIMQKQKASEGDNIHRNRNFLQGFKAFKNILLKY